MSCIIFQLNSVDSVFHSQLVNSSFEMFFILNVKSSDSTFFTLNQLPLINVKGRVLWDSNYLFERQNKLFTADPSLRTFMTDTTGCIIQYGNPMAKPDVIKDYFERLSNP